MSPPRSRTLADDRTLDCVGSQCYNCVTNGVITHQHHLNPLLQFHNQTAGFNPALEQIFNSWVTSFRSDAKPARNSLSNRQIRPNLVSIEIGQQIESSQGWFEIMLICTNVHFLSQQFYRNGFAMNHSKQKIVQLVSLPKTRAAHLFPKSERFMPPKVECPEAFYSYASVLERRATHFGYGKKSDFTHSTVQSPPSNKYNLLSPIGKTRGRSFGCSRQASEKFSYINPELKFLPGPGQYQSGVIARSFLQGQSKTIEAVDKKEPFPYSPGNYFVSKYRTTKYGTIDPNAQRFPEIKPSPGPTDYNIGDISRFQSGYIVSSYRGAGSRHFDKEARFTDSHWKLSENPGPGKYFA